MIDRFYSNTSIIYFIVSHLYTNGEVIYMNTKLMITKRKRGEDGHKILSIRVREDIINRLDALADETGRSRNELIGLLLDFAINNSEVVAEK